MADAGLSIEMLPARHGDALWIEWGDAGGRRRMLIDGGPAATFETLRTRFEELDPDDRHVDLMVITHIDLDHIDGAIRLLRDESLDVSYSDVWFNDFHHLSDEPLTRGAMQGEFLGAVLNERRLPWNAAFDGRAVVVPATGSLPSVRLEGGLRLVLLSPTAEKLDKLKAKWEQVVEEAGMEPGDRAEALARLEDRLGPATRGGSRKSFGGDGSEANGSSIAFIAEYGDERWLLAGDAHQDALIAGLRRYAAEIGRTPVPLDGFKIPHHGSVNNISPSLLAEIDCRTFYVSTNGSYFKHPDEACIDLIVTAADRPELVFNYRTDFTEKWAATSSDYTSSFTNGTRGADRGGLPGAPVDRREQHPDHEELRMDASPTSTESDDTGSDDTASANAASGGDRSAPSTESPGQPVEVTVFHGSLEHAEHPVLVGHYLATPLSGAEGFVDRRVQGSALGSARSGSVSGADRGVAAGEGTAAPPSAERRAGGRAR